MAVGIYGKLLEEQDGDVLREGIRVLSQVLMEAEVSGVIGAERHERTGDRTTYRNGYRTRTWNTRVGTIELQIPKLRSGTYFPSLLQPRRRIEHALLAVVQEPETFGGLVQAHAAADVSREAFISGTVSFERSA